MNKVFMVQTSLFFWKITTKHGNTIQKDISLHNLYQAEQFIKAWISSYGPNWTYEILPLD